MHRFDISEVILMDYAGLLKWCHDNNCESWKIEDFNNWDDLDFDAKAPCYIVFNDDIEATLFRLTFGL
jgi:hypothetical protein